MPGDVLTAAEVAATTEDARRRPAPLGPLALYLLAFYAVWSIYFVVLTPHFGRGPAYTALENVAKLAIWTLPVIVLVRVAEGERALDYLKLRRSWRRGLVYGLGLGLAVSLYLVLLKLRGGGIHFDPFFAAGEWVSGVILIGFTEEVVFRGFILQKLGARLDFRWANLATSLLFVLVHLPRWIRDERLGPGIAGAALFLLAFSLLLGWALRRSGSLWACALAHSLGNFTSFALGSSATTGLAFLL
ncbi:MAG: type II CAAX endopeptidase family protein [Gaiellaceae bacterium]